MEWLLEIALVVLLAATLFHALRLERALGVLKRDRAALQDLVNGFNSSTQAAEQGIARLRAAADGAGRHIARQTETAQGLKDDLQFLAERGERLADRLEQLVRAGRSLVQAPEPAGYEAAEPEADPAPATPAGAELPRARSQAERDLLKALRMAR
ncbi:DUF6468 domain-containing protein [Limobrevibacterium gyesilva]|uniref:DUF6468 domain-containing protein n=1 Tax=Limobrevibacterium gyesilva TaxID=2991712 RepID=A0AA42CHL6_9PROT|nr:DUF6468 domain-containing protein [Limobrevibacterium gyesilva]MCW3475112.1 DUF6468 domain-containing protein [Limobrevibacterium gyesilva]